MVRLLLVLFFMAPGLVNAQELTPAEAKATNILNLKDQNQDGVLSWEEYIYVFDTESDSNQNNSLEYDELLPILTLSTQAPIIQTYSQLVREGHIPVSSKEGPITIGRQENEPLITSKDVFFIMVGLILAILSFCLYRLAWSLFVKKKP